MKISFAVGVALVAALFLSEILAGVALGAYVLGIVDPNGAFALVAAIGSMPLRLFDAGYEEIDIR